LIHRLMCFPRRRYFVDCRNAINKVPAFSFYRPPSETHFSSGEAAWEKMFPGLPFHINYDTIDLALADMIESLSGVFKFSPTATPAQILPTIPKSTIAYDLETAAQRQKTFFYQVSLPHYRDPQFIENAINRCPSGSWERLSWCCCCAICTILVLYCCLCMFIELKCMGRARSQTATLFCLDSDPCAVGAGLLLRPYSPSAVLELRRFPPIHILSPSKHDNACSLCTPRAFTNRMCMAIPYLIQACAYDCTFYIRSIRLQHGYHTAAALRCGSNG
jgi:hypothetical protein